ncbi:hypothetical protein, partial [Streptomyces clavuligerus]|uniref:hypothetical protein n=1 Tax=Streptomyces clavuligerus TaxID=1901 RepID=UPI001E4ED8A8
MPSPTVLIREPSIAADGGGTAVRAAAPGTDGADTAPVIADDGGAETTADGAGRVCTAPLTGVGVGTD